MKILNLSSVFIIGILIAISSIANTQSAADDEVDIVVPNYGHKFYSGKIKYYL